MWLRVTFRDGRTLEVEGDEAGFETSGAVLIYREVSVMNRTRRIVARRFLAAEGVSSVDPVEDTTASAPD